MGSRDSELPNELLLVDEVAELLRTTPARVYALARENRITGVVRLGRQLRFDRASLVEWIRKGGFQLPGGWRREPQHDEARPAV